MTIQFQVGTTYATRSACDYDCIYSFTVVARTAKTITITSHWGEKRRGLRLIGGAEAINPLGSYSMAPVLRADRDAVAPQAHEDRCVAAYVAEGLGEI